MSVVVDLETLTGGSRPGVLPDGSPIPAEDARRIALNANISRIITDPASLPLDVGRENRLATPAQRKGLEVRDRGCVVDGVHITRHPNGKITYRIPRRNTPTDRRTRNGRTRDVQTRDGPDTHAA